ncbi:MAG: PDZ domain-containing protein [Planctomycetales bacterium]|nr:PDZ domain-containing protein [Planctomycetales bacterium]
MKRAARFLTALSTAAILSAAWGSVVGGEDAVPAVKTAPKEGSKRPATPAELEKWASNLDSDEFLAREEATLRLIAAGTPAIKYVQPIVSAPSLEASTRALHVLRDIGLSSDLDTQEAVRTALEEIAKQPSPAGKRASRTTAWLNEQRSSQTIRDLEQLGAKIQRTEYSDGLQEIVNVEAVQLGPGWKGDDKDLRRLKWLVDVRQLVLIGDKMGDSALAQAALMPGLKSLHLHRTAVTDKGMQILAGCGALQEFGAYYSGLGDEGIAPLSKLPSLTSVKLYGTKVTPEAKERLGTALNQLAKIDFRRGGFLGISCAPDFDGLCRISTVHPDSPASKAGLQTRDVLVRFAGKELKDFEGLTAIISQHQAGENLEVEILRDVLDPDEKQKTIKLKVTLGEWDVDLSVSGGRLPRP